MAQPLPLPFSPDDSNAWHRWADEQLAPMDLTVDELHLVADEGQRKYDSTSPLAPTTTPGTDRWSIMVTTFRQLTGWAADNSHGLPRTVHPSEKFYVVIRTGTDGVGDFKGQPTPRHPLGDVLRRVIDGTPNTMALFGLPDDVVDPDDRELWLFLTEKHPGEIHCELSAPSARDGGFVTDYKQRIPLPPLPYTEPADPTGTLPTEPDDLSGPEIDIQPI